MQQGGSQQATEAAIDRLGAVARQRLQITNLDNETGLPDSTPRVSHILTG
jgi:hypothetical protein